MSQLCAFAERGEGVDGKGGLGRDEFFDVAFETAEESCGEGFGGVVNELAHVEAADQNGEMGLSNVSVLGGTYGCDEGVEVAACKIGSLVEEGD